MAALKRLKVTPKILTGDQAAIAVSVCHRVGISAEAVLTGAKLDEMTDSELRKAVEEIYVLRNLLRAKGASGFRSAGKRSLGGFPW